MAEFWGYFLCWFVRPKDNASSIVVVLNIFSVKGFFFSFDDLARETETGRKDETGPVQRPVSGLGGKAKIVFQNRQRL